MPSTNLPKIHDASGEDTRAQMRTVAYLLRVIGHTMPKQAPRGVDLGVELNRQLVFMAGQLEAGEPGAVHFFENARKRAMADDYARKQAHGITVITDGDLRAAQRMGFAPKVRR